MSTREWSVGYDEGYMKGWNDAMDEKPAQQEPVAIALNTGTKQGVKWLKNVEHGEHLYTSPQPAQRTWVGLADDEIEKELEPFPLWISNWDHWDIMNFAAAIEAKLKEKNA